MKTSCLLLVLVASLLPGCAMMGREQVDKEHQVRVGRPGGEGDGESEQVTSILGAPQEIIFSNKEHDPSARARVRLHPSKDSKYTAIFLAFISFGNMDQKSDRVVVFFDEAGTVAHVGSSLDADKTHYGFPFGE